MANFYGNDNDELLTGTVAADEVYGGAGEDIF